MAQVAIPIGLALAGGAAGAVASKVLAPKPAATPMPQPLPTRNMAAEAARAGDQWRRRRGAGANELTGGGAEARSPGGKTLLGQ